MQKHVLLKMDNTQTNNLGKEYGGSNQTIVSVWIYQVTVLFSLLGIPYQEPRIGIHIPLKLMYREM